MTSAVYAGVREILAGPDWEPVTVTDHGQFFTISGYFRSMAHTGSRKDWESLARDLDRIAREQFDALMGKAEPTSFISADDYNVRFVEVADGLVAEEPEPDTRDAELEVLRARIEALEDAKRELEARELELKDANATLKDALSDIEDRIADLDEEADERPPLDAEAEAALTTDDLLGESDDVASDVISKLSRDRRRRFTELLNVELAELQLARGGPKEDRRREQKIERLLGIFARAGEM